MKKRNRQTDRANWFCCVSHDPEQIEHLKSSCKDFKRWFWIEHKPDSEDGSDHLHLMVMYGGSCYLRTCARILGIPENFVQFCDSHRAYAQYMIHLHNDEKIKYQISDVHTNYPGLYKSMIVDSANDDVSMVFDDIKKLYNSQISLDEFIERHYLELQCMPLYQKIKTFESLCKLSSVRST